MRKKIVAGNWKMNLLYEEGLQLVRDILQAKPVVAADRLAVICPSFITLQATAALLVDQPYCSIGAQNCATHLSGAYTGEVSASQLRSVGVEYVIIGHSERRQLFSETNVMIAAKVRQALDCNMKVIFCCGEPLEVRDEGGHNAYVAAQISDSLFDLQSADLQNLIIAYEPIWAIGTGRNASVQQAQDMHAFIRSHISGKFGEAVAQDLSILYGGSCKPSNAKELFACPDVDGGLIGGASLVASDFVSIINSF